MKCILSWALRSAFLALLLVHVQPAALLATEPSVVISTGAISGVYYSAGGAVAKMYNMKRKEFGGWMANQASEGSLENIGGVLDGDVDFGISQANFLLMAWNGEMLWENPHKDLRAVMGLYVEDVTLIAAVDSGINTPEDLKGKRLSIGAAGSSDNITSDFILKRLGIDPENDLVTVERPTYEGAELIQSNDIDAYFYTVGHPNLSVMEAINGDRQVRIVPFSQNFIDEVAALQPYLTASSINTEYYENLANDGSVPTIGIKSVLFTRADQDEETVYRVVKQIVENADLFKRQHPALSQLNREKVTQGVIVPLHPGAERFFRERGAIQ